MTDAEIARARDRAKETCDSWAKRFLIDHGFDAASILYKPEIERLEARIADLESQRLLRVGCEQCGRIVEPATIPEGCKP